MFVHTGVYIHSVTFDMPQRLISSTQWEQVTLKLNRVTLLQLPELGTRFFEDFALLGEALRACAFALFFGPSISRLCVRAFAPRAHLLFALFSRYSIFRARTFALLDFRAHNFVLVRLYTARTGQPEQDSQNKTATMGQVEQDCHDRKAKTGQPGHES
jgi:hypothetical protein